MSNIHFYIAIGLFFLGYTIIGYKIFNERAEQYFCKLINYWIQPTDGTTKIILLYMLASLYTLTSIVFWPIISILNKIGKIFRGAMEDNDSKAQ